MRIDHNTTTELVTISSCTDHTITINELIYTSSVLLHQNNIKAPWVINGTTEFTKHLWQNLLQIQADIYLIGTGQSTTIRPSQIAAPPQAPIEIMNLSSACRVFNLLQLEKRNIVGIFFASAPA